MPKAKWCIRGGILHIVGTNYPHVTSLGNCHNHWASCSYDAGHWVLRLPISRLIWTKSAEKSTTRVSEGNNATFSVKSSLEEAAESLHRKMSHISIRQQVDNYPLKLCEKVINGLMTELMFLRNVLVLKVLLIIGEGSHCSVYETIALNCWNCNVEWQKLQTNPKRPLSTTFSSSQHFMPTVIQNSKGNWLTTEGGLM